MKLDQDEMRRRIQGERVVRLATVDDRGRAHVVPVIFAVDGDIFYSPTDKPKEANPLPPKRLRNLEHNQQVTVLADCYDEDWLKAWWVRLRGPGRVIGESAERTHALGLVDQKYAQFAGDLYEERGGPVLAVDIKDWLGWAYSNQSAQAQPTQPRSARPWRRPRIRTSQPAI
jgi:PPOX class probable F420-dependent enzyme